MLLLELPCHLPDQPPRNPLTTCPRLVHLPKSLKDLIPRPWLLKPRGGASFSVFFYVLFGIFPFLVLSQAASKQEPSVKQLSKSNMQV